MAEKFDSRYFAGAGTVLIGARDATGKPKGLTYIGQATSAELTPNIEKETLQDFTTCAGGIASEFIRSIEYSFAMTLNSVKCKHLAKSLSGTCANNVAGNVTDEAHTAYHDTFIALAHQDVSSVVVKDSAGTTTYTVDTDYVVNAAKGLIEIVGSGAITDASEVKVSYSYTANYVVTANPTSQQYYFVFAGANKAENCAKVRCEIYKLTLDPGVLSMITAGHAEINVTGTVLKDDLRAAGDQFYRWMMAA